MSELQLHVEPFAGTSIDTACQAAMALADKLYIVVGFDFNGVHCMARPGDAWFDLRDAWARELASGHQIKIACASRALKDSP